MLALSTRYDLLLALPISSLGVSQFFPVFSPAMRFLGSPVNE